MSTLNQQQTYKIKTKQTKQKPLFSLAKGLGKRKHIRDFTGRFISSGSSGTHFATLVATVELKQADQFLSHNRWQQVCTSIHSSDPKRADVSPPLPIGREPPNTGGSWPVTQWQKPIQARCLPALYPTAQSEPGLVSYTVSSSREPPKSLGSWPSISSSRWPRVDAFFSQKHHQRQSGSKRGKSSILHPLPNDNGKPREVQGSVINPHRWYQQGSQWGAQVEPEEGSKTKIALKGQQVNYHWNYHPHGRGNGWNRWRRLRIYLSWWALSYI